MGNPADIEKAARKAAIKCAIRGLDKEADTILALADSHARLVAENARIQMPKMLPDAPCDVSILRVAVHDTVDNMGPMVVRSVTHDFARGLVHLRGDRGGDLITASDASTIRVLSWGLISHYRKNPLAFD